MLLRTSYGDRTSPVLRGAWVLDKLNGTPPTPPPPDTATDLSQKAGEQPKTVRARLEQHRDKASCRMCHGVIDPTGLALENFDAIGQWRTTDSQANAPIDASTVLPSGVADQWCRGTQGATGRPIPETFARTVTEKTDDVRALTASWNTSICRRFAPLFVARQKTITSCRPSFWESSIATLSASRVPVPGKVSAVSE